MRQERLFWVFFLLAILAYLLPWAANSASGLTMGAYDLAEWFSKSAMYDTGIYYSVMALRGQLFFLSILLAFGAQKPYFTAEWWARCVLGLLLVVAQLPALNMLPSIGVDVNRQQQVILAVASVVVLVVGLTAALARWKAWIYLLGLILAFGTSIYGMTNALNLMNAFALAPAWGFGLILYLGILLALFLSSGRSLLTKNPS